ncbi:bifunctional DNA primase/polymerase [Dactylosporangium sp. NPDC000521]|uniref:bifunctional DNA primase/polymerase n=1 Tax=Dactylosporangium sp. NPDC000521 TaxID=3363975 RepID=UPI00369AC26B
MELRPDRKALLRNAMETIARGWYVFPVAVNAKWPALHGVRDCPRSRLCADGHLGWEQRATIDPERVERCWSSAPYNVGIACGPSGLLVIDLDVPKPGQEPPEGCGHYAHGGAVFRDLCAEAGKPYPDDTHTVTTGRRGTHLYFEHPTDGPQLRNTASGNPGALGWLIDTRAHGGYVLAAGSIVDGRPYTTALDRAPMLLPGWLAERLTPAPTPPRKPVVVALPADRRGGYLRAAVERECAVVAATSSGRNRALYGAAVALGQLVAGGELPADYVTDALTAAAEACGLHLDPPPGQIGRTIASGLRAGAKRPRTVAA